MDRLVFVGGLYGSCHAGYLGNLPDICLIIPSTPSLRFRYHCPGNDMLQTGRAYGG